MKLALEFVQPMPLMIWAAILIESLSVRAQLTGRRGRRLSIDCFAIVERLGLSGVKSR